MPRTARIAPGGMVFNIEVPNTPPLIPPRRTFRLPATRFGSFHLRGWLGALSLRVLAAPTPSSGLRPASPPRGNAVKHSESHYLGVVDSGREARLSRTPLPPNRACDFPAHGSPVSSCLQRIDRNESGPRADYRGLLSQSSHSASAVDVVNAWDLSGDASIATA